ncbi:metal-dependent hydrolase [Halococcoides cellulosivorans]|uniref:metal-dependent hydrolase n=1 Tax=Halococcoides cellulosivorans TaxID=1679096 RepID=UPI00131EFC8C|nr:metal-dependent hydrolase [Halococcoides cellulosivorans]
MYRKGHIGIGIALYAPVAFWLASVDLMGAFGVGLVCVTFVSYAPDFDVWLPLVAHRGATHTVLAAVLVSLAIAGGSVALGVQSGLIASSPGAMGTTGGFVVGVTLLGYLGHLAGDALTPMGIRPFRPVSNRRYSLDLVTASNETANTAFATVGTLALSGALVLGVDFQDGVVDVVAAI